jgi:DNA-binding MurR/RpiR family transcriptional regulator
LAQYILNNDAKIAFASANDVGQAVGSSAATVVRFARALGYEGYSELQEDIRSKLSNNYTASQQLAQRISDGALSDDLATDIAKINAQNIHDTLRQVEPQTLDAVVDALLSARNIQIYGGGMSGAAVYMAQHSFAMLGLSARAVINGGLSQTLELSHLSDRDVVIVVSIWRYLRETMAAVKYASSVGATTIALSDSLVAPIARKADYVLVAATERAAHSRSMTGMISLIDLINASIIAKSPEIRLHAIKRIDDLYLHQNELVEQ